jgi:two-component system nitrogen regulation sensor histidine kinase NtrY
MSYRAKVSLATVVTVLLSVWLVALIASAVITRTFEEREAARTAALVAQFHREFDRRAEELNRRVDAVANSQDVARIAAILVSENADVGPFFNDAATLAQEQSLDFLELVGPDGAIISSAQWPARFAYKEPWLTQADWRKQPAFLKREDLAEGPALGLFAVRTVPAGERLMYVAGGERLDRRFLDSLSTSEGMRVELWDAASTPPADLAPLVDDVRRARADRARIVRGGSESMTAIPLAGRDGDLLAVLTVASSRRDLLAIKHDIRNTGLAVAAGGAALGILLSWWAAARVTRPVSNVAASVRAVAAGAWDTRAAIESDDEIGRLARDFNEMTAQLVEQKQRIVQTERVAAWRELARRLAHELKNPLFPLQITVENLQRARDAPPDQFDEVFRESTATLIAELQNLKSIISRFSDFAKMPAPQLESVDLNEIARETMRLFEPQFQAPGRPSIAARLDLDRDLPPVSADPDQIRRALRNLVLNAMDAMPNGGTVSIRTLRRNGRAAIEVADTGEGLTQEECERLFTPYYTTKRHGTGLGLAIVQSVVSDHKASISVESEPGRGATFRIEFNA